jgi:hypothetical protein
MKRYVIFPAWGYSIESNGMSRLRPWWRVAHAWTVLLCFAHRHLS